MDVSFISMTLIVPGLSSLLKPRGRFLGLVKPQFEVGREGLGKGGIVRDDKLFSEVKAKTCASCLAQGLAVEDYFESSLRGTDGNREFFIFAQNH
jgi:23S rRNA (cytidine1920-2'-O)/16S rRNA (cytidine1409-2'-O)-methyltransferase